MDYQIYVIIAFLGAIAAGLLGSLTGLGGGIIVIPMLTLGFGVDIHYAIGAGLITVIATSAGSSARFLQTGITNVRIGLFLEIATTLGAIGGAILAGLIPESILYILFAGILIFSGVMTLRQQNEGLPFLSDNKTAKKFQLEGNYLTTDGTLLPYRVAKPRLGFITMIFAGMVSGLLGIGSGSLKVIAMDLMMKLPFKVSTTTSNFMIGVTAIASTVVYFQRGQIIPEIIGPVMPGVIIGSILGSKLLPKISVKQLKYIFVVVIFITSIQMLLKGL